MVSCVFLRFLDRHRGQELSAETDNCSLSSLSVVVLLFSYIQLTTRARDKQYIVDGAANVDNRNSGVETIGFSGRKIPKYLAQEGKNFLRRFPRSNFGIKRSFVRLYLNLKKIYYPWMNEWMNEIDPFLRRLRHLPSCLQHIFNSLFGSRQIRSSGLYSDGSESILSYCFLFIGAVFDLIDKQDQIRCIFFTGWCQIARDLRFRFSLRTLNDHVSWPSGVSIRCTFLSLSERN